MIYGVGSIPNLYFYFNEGWRVRDEIFNAEVAEGLYRAINPSATSALKSSAAYSKLL